MSRTRSRTEPAPAAGSHTIELTLDEDVFARVREAASKIGQNVDDYIRYSVVVFTDEVIDDGPHGVPRVLRLSPQESRQLDEALDRPAEPNAAMLRAAELCRKLIAE